MNATSSRNYYTYTPGGSWHLTTVLEAQKNKMGGANDKVSTDRGKFPDLYEVGTNLTLSPLDYGDTGLVGYWNFEEGPSATLNDYSGKGNTGTWYGSTLAANRYTAGKVGRYSGYFNGSDDYLRFSYSNSLNITNKELSISFWIKPYTTHNDWGYLVCHMGTESGYSYCFAWRENFSNIITLYTEQSIGHREISGNAITNLNSWRHIVATYDGSYLRYYENGEPLAPYAVNGDIKSNTIGLRIGGTPGRSFFHDTMDDIRIYNRTLSTAEVQALYQASN